LDYGLRMMLGGGFYFWLIPLAILLLVIYSAYKAFSPRKEYIGAGNNQSAIDILKARFAKGEISEEEYLSKKSKLE